MIQTSSTPSRTSKPTNRGVGFRVFQVVYWLIVAYFIYGTIVTAPEGSPDDLHTSTRRILGTVIDLALGIGIYAVIISVIRRRQK